MEVPQYVEISSRSRSTHELRVHLKVKISEPNFQQYWMLLVSRLIMLVAQRPIQIQRRLKQSQLEALSITPVVSPNEVERVGKATHRSPMRLNRRAIQAVFNRPVSVSIGTLTDKISDFLTTEESCKGAAW
ncbi:hypothetical protein AXG93_4242s1240 [Marchantia polymorpha subsp. ruderalis]|uniref:Uncharacterized protein n=1 Tax=Marchantia polymorpha subsp. ruderalis TaxID=1480154 RepID=A0A176VX53_MARPO|nr:hypothetical protein AXG93_4242s1240 [Marchantia polymorpha subsp. ruderalis]